MKAVRFRFVSTKNFRWIGINVFRTFAILPIYDFFPKNFNGNSDFEWKLVYGTRSECFFLLNRIQLMEGR